MHAQLPRIIIYSFSASSEADQLLQKIADIGYTHVIKSNDREHLEQLIDDSSYSALVLQMTDILNSQKEILDILNLVKPIPVMGLLSQYETQCDKSIVMKCHEVTIWPCSNQELDFRMRKLTSCCCQKQNLGHSLFVNMNILGNSPKFLQVLDKVCKISKHDVPTLIEGETGTGKELIARAIHYLSYRKDYPFVAVNCGALPDQLIENELFGHYKGAYTDAHESCEGIIAQAEGGTLFLDEIEALSAKGQITLLRFLEDMQYRSLGSKSETYANIRLITATNDSISQMVKKGDFRKDLYYRLNVIKILLPPLRERSGDINVLAEHFILRFQIQYNQLEKKLHPNTQEGMKYYDWPGNVRELEHIIHQEFLLTDSKYISIKKFESLTQERRINQNDRRNQKLFSQSFSTAKKKIISGFEQKYLESVLERANGNISKAARLAGKERRTFTRLLEKYAINCIRIKNN